MKITNSPSLGIGSVSTAVRTLHRSLLISGITPDEMYGISISLVTFDRVHPFAAMENRELENVVAGCARMRRAKKKMGLKWLI